MLILLLLCSLTFSKPLVEQFSSELGEVETGDNRKILHRYDPSLSVLKKRNAVPNPQAGLGPSILVTVGATTYHAVLYNGFVSFDHNQNGELESQERARMVQVGREYRARVSADHLLSEESRPSHVVFVSTNLKKNLGYIEDMKRKGVLWDGTPFYIHSVNGLFHHPESKIALDVNQDSISDVHHVLYKTTLGKGSISWDGGIWKPSLSAGADQIQWERIADAVLSVGKVVPKIETFDIRNKRREIGGQSIQPVVLDFWATWCASCVRDHKKLRKIQRRYGVSVLGIANNSKREIRRYTKKRRIRWPQISLQDHPQIQEIYSIDALPRYVLIDSKGVLRFMGTMKGLEEELTRP